MMQLTTVSFSLTPATVLRAAPGQVSSDLGGETVVLNLQTSLYYSLNPIGAFVWNLLQQPCSAAAIQARLLETYDVDPERCTADLHELLGQLISKGLIEVDPVTFD